MASGYPRRRAVQRRVEATGLSMPGSPSQPRAERTLNGELYQLAPELLVSCRTEDYEKLF
jgi:hypothetical protein